MLFRTKNYLSVSLSDMKIFADDNRRNIIREVDKNDTLLSDGTEVKLFFEYYPQKNIRDYGIVKEILTGVEYERSFVFFKMGDNCLYSKNAGTVCFDTSNNIVDVSRKEIQQYLKKLREKRLYEEYVKKIKDFYTTASKSREESLGMSR